MLVSQKTKEALKEFKTVESQQYKLRSSERDAEHNRLLRKMDEVMSKLEGKLVPATKLDYNRWLGGYMESGKKPTHFYDYPMGRSLNEYYLATKDFEMGPLYGAKAINIIVPDGVKFLGGEIGHCNIYLMEGSKAIGSFVPVFQDTSF